MKKLLFLLFLATITIFALRPLNERVELLDFDLNIIDLQERYVDIPLGEQYVIEKFYPTSDFSFPASTDTSNPIRLWATWYYLHQTSEAAEGTSDSVLLRDINGNSLGVKLTRHDWCRSAMQGSVNVLLINGQRKMFGHAGKTDAYKPDCSTWYNPATFTVEKNKFVLSDGPFGRGARYYVLPFRSIAVDPTVIPYGSVLYIPDARGTRLILPDGRTATHDGYFFAADTGSAIIGNHIDVFLGVTTTNPFAFIKSTSSGKFQAYIVNNQTINDSLTYAHNNPNSTTATGTVRFISPTNGSTSDNPVIFESAVTGDIASVKYYAESNYFLGESNNALNSFRFEYSYSGINRMRTVKVQGFDSSGIAIPSAVEEIQFTPMELGSGSLSFITPSQSDVENPVKFSVLKTGDIYAVRYYAERQFLLGESDNSSNNYEIEYSFSSLGVRKIQAIGVHQTGVPITGAEVEISIQVNPQSCVDECELNQKRCQNSNVEICEESNGCKTWRLFSVCGEGETCQSAVCVNSGSCEDECESGEKLCYGDTLLECGEFDSDECLDWGAIETCNLFDICTLDGCREPNCTSECSAGSKKCEGDSVIICAVKGDALCYKWYESEDCEGQCRLGECINITCKDECISGEKRCSRSEAQSCQDIGSCMRYQTTKVCSEEELCINGNCMPKYLENGRCVPFIRACEESNIIVCKEDGSGYQYGLTCESGEYCDNGYCYEKTSTAKKSSGGCSFETSNSNSILAFLFIALLSIFTIRKRYR